MLLCVVLLLSFGTVAYAAPAKDETPSGKVVETIVSGKGEDAETFTFVEAASNENFILAYDEETTFISLTDKRTKQVWYSNPPININADPYVEGIAKTNIRSVLSINYTNSSLKVKDTNSYSGSVMKGSYEIKNVKDGVRIDYTFKELKVTVPVQYTLTEDGMIAEVLFKDIVEESTNHINSMDFLTYFGAAGEKDKGYLVVPDGSGAIVNFNNEKNVDGMIYSKEIYDFDKARLTESKQETSTEETITMPVFGMVKNGYGFLAEVTSGAETAKLRAAVSGNRLIGGYNIIHTNCTYRVNYEISLMGQVSSETSNAMYNAQDPVSNESYAVQYHFTDSKKTDYMMLAAKYREILTERGWLTKDEVTDRFYVDIYGGVNKKKSFFGVVYNARQTLTSFDEAQTILKDLVDGGVKNITASYLDYSNDHFKNDIQVDLAPSKSLGGKNAMADLIKFAGDNGITMGVEANFVKLPSGGNGFSTFNDTADAINISPIKVYPISLNANTTQLAKKPYYLVDPQVYAKGVDSILDATSEYGYTGLYFDEEALQLYSDLSIGGFQRERASGAQAEQYARLAEAGQTLTMSNPNAYLFAYADYMTDIPVCSSKEILFDEDVPFLQAVLRGSKNFGGESMNITDVSDEAFLRHIEFGTDMKYALINADSEALLNTEDSFLYSATYKTFAEQIKTRYAEFMTVADAIGDATMVAHSAKNNVSVTEYDNGTKVYVNYNDKAVTVDGTAVEAMSFAIV